VLLPHPIAVRLDHQQIRSRHCLVLLADTRHQNGWLFDAIADMTNLVIEVPTFVIPLPPQRAKPLPGANGLEALDSPAGIMRLAFLPSQHKRHGLIGDPI
jgi:hypothetical protein